MAGNPAALSPITAPQEEYQMESPQHQLKEMRRPDKEGDQEVNVAGASFGVANSSGFIAQGNLQVPEEHSPGEERDLLQGELRLRKLPSKRHDRIDGLQHLSPLQSERLEPGIEISPVYGIVSAVIRFDLWAVTARFLQKDIKSGETYRQDDFTALMHEEMKIVNFNEPIRYFGLYEQEESIDQYVKSFSEEHAICRIRDLTTRHFLSHVLQIVIGIASNWDTLHKIVQNSKTFEMPKWAIAQGLSWVDYAEKVGFEAKEGHGTQVRLYELILSLHAQTCDAARKGLLDDISLEALKVRMSGIQNGFYDFCKAIDRPTVKLVWQTESWWRDPELPDPKPLFIDSSPKNVVQAFSHHDGVSSNNANSFLAFLVPVISLLSCIPATLSWMHSSHALGAATDADFFQLVSNTSMQILGILTLMIPTRFNGRLVGQPWFWTWLLATVSTVCYVAAVPLYLYAPTEWSAAVSFAGSAFQAFTTLQLMFAI